MVVLTERLNSNSEAVKRLYIEYNMNPEQVREDIFHIRDWMAKQPYLPEIPPSKDDEINFWIEGYLRLTKNSIEKTKIAIDHYFKGKSVFREIFGAVNDLHNYVQSEFFSNIYMMLLPKLTPDGLRILLYGVTSEDARLFHPVDFFRRMVMVLDIQQKAGIDFSGIYVIIYARYGTLGHIAQFDLSFLKKVFKLAKKAFPIRLKHTHIVYAPAFIEAAVKIMKPFLSKKVMSRISVHHDLETLWEMLPKEVLPADLGGELPTMHELQEVWKARIIDHQEWFLSNLNMVSDESKRISKDEKDKFGANGTFRKLSLD